MALHQSALLELLEALKAADIDDRICSGTETLYQAVIEAELTAVIGAGPDERTETRTAQCNGSRPRILITTAGDLELRIPKLRAARSFVAAGTRRRIDQALFAPAGLHRLPDLALEENLVDQSVGTAEQGRSSAAPTWSASSPTPPPYSAWPVRSWSRHTTNGRSPTATSLLGLHGPARRAFRLC